MKITQVANALITDTQGKFLLTQRHDPLSPKTHLKWQIPGGGIEKGETAYSACLREAKEETGLSIEILHDTPFIVNQTYPDAEFTLHVFLAKPSSGTINTDLDEETADAQWYTIEQISRLKTLDNTLEMIDGCLKIWKKH